MEEMPSLNMPVQRLKVAILPLDLTLLCARNPFRGNFNHWQVSRKEAGQIFLFYNKFIICLYMFRALCAHYQEVKIVLYSIWYHHNL